MVQRAVNVKIKAGLKSSAMVRNLDAYCLRGHRLSHITSAKVQIQRFNIKEFKPKESKPIKFQLAKNNILTPPRFKSIEPGKISYTDKKKEYLRKNGTEKKISWHLGITSTPLKVVRRNGIIEAMEDATIARKKAIFRGTAQNL